MIQRRRRAGFQQKTIQRTLFAREVCGQEFERDLAAQREILRLVDDPHAAATQPACNPIMRNNLVDHEVSAESLILGRRDVSVNEGDIIMIRPSQIGGMTSTI